MADEKNFVEDEEQKSTENRKKVLTLHPLLKN